MNKKIELSRLDQILDLAKSKGYEIVGIICADSNNSAFYPSDFVCKKFNQDVDRISHFADEAFKKHLNANSEQIKVY